MKNLRYVILAAMFSFLSGTLSGQHGVPKYYVHDDKFTKALHNIIKQANLDSAFDTGEDGKETISLAVIDLSQTKPVFGGVYYDNFIYPASVYKMYVAMEVFNQAGEGKFSLYDQYIVKAPNDVDRSKEILFDPRPLLRAGDTVSVYYLLDLMITRSDNSAANCLIDLTGRPNINATMKEYNWTGSEVTRKFLKRKLEDPGYDTIRSTATCASHAADFMYKIYSNTLITPWVSMHMKSLLGSQLDTTKLSTGLPLNAMFYHKSGWWSYFTHDVGIVDDGSVKYIVALFTPVTEERVRPRLKIVSEKIYALMKQRAARKSP
ncbi:MAG TPA: serine hydrolase [Cyclobacteriaceae bacterium]